MLKVRLSDCPHALTDSCSVVVDHVSVPPARSHNPRQYLIECYGDRMLLNANAFVVTIDDVVTIENRYVVVMLGGLADFSASLPCLCRCTPTPSVSLSLPPTTHSARESQDHDKSQIQKYEVEQINQTTTTIHQLDSVIRITQRPVALAFGSTLLPAHALDVVRCRLISLAMHYYARKRMRSRNQIIRSRKRKLCRLYALATSAEPLPTPIDLDDAHNPGLTNFLQLNDLAHGRYLQKSTIPSRSQAPYNVQSLPRSAGINVVRSRPQSDAVPNSESSAQQNASSLFPSSSSDAATVATDPQHITNGIHGPRESAHSTLQPPHAADVTLPLGSQDIDRPPLRRKLTKTDLAIDVTPARYSPSSKSVRLQSPPDSGGEGNDNDELSYHQNVVPPDASHTPASDVQMQDVHQPLSPTSVALDSTSHQRLDALPHSAALQPPSAAEPTSSPSSAAGRRSAHTSVTENESPATSLDDEQIASQHSPRRRLPVALPAISREDAADAVDHARERSHRAGGAQTIAAPKTMPAPQDRAKTVAMSDRTSHLSAVMPGQSSFSHEKTHVTARPRTFRVRKGRMRQSRGTARLLLDRNRRSMLARSIKDLQDDRKGLSVEKSLQKRDYMSTMFLRQALDSVHGADLGHLLSESNKTLSTADWLASMREEQDCRTIRRIYKLQDNNRWSPRQFKRSVEPIVKSSHQDVLIAELVGMQQDFRSERIGKMAVARDLAGMCAAWVNADDVDRASMRVGNKQLKLHEDTGPALEFCRPGDLLMTTEQETSDPGVLRYFGDDDSTSLTGGVHLLDDKLFKQLPPTLGAESPESASGLPANAPPNDWQLSKYRDPTAEVLTRLDSYSDQVPAAELAPESRECTLFDPRHEHFRRRLLAAHTLKPPIAPVPPQTFYEFRAPSQWTPEEDAQLKNYVKDFAPNWALISDRMAPRSTFTSSADRKTPWECYERYINNENLAGDSTARTYARTFFSRVESAKAKWAEQQAHLQRLQQQASANNPTQQPIPIKRYPAPTRVALKQGKRLYVLVDAARRLARKRETAAQKTLHPPTEAPPKPLDNMPKQHTGITPQALSNKKHELELLEKKKLEEARIQAMKLLEHNKALEMQRRQQQMLGQANANQQAQVPNGVALQMRGNAAANSAAAQIAHVAIPGAAQARPQSQHPAPQIAAANGTPSNAPNAMRQMPNGMMQRPQLNGTPQMTPEALRLMQQQQRQIQMQNQQNLASQQHLRASSAVNGVSSPGAPSTYNGHALASGDGQSPSMQVAHTRPQTNSSPHPLQAMGAPNHNGNPASARSIPVNSMAQQLHAHYTRLHPNETPERIKLMVNDHLKSLLQQQRNNALAAASGVHGQPHQSPIPAQQANNKQQHFIQQQQQQHANYVNGMLASQVNGQVSSPVQGPAMAHVQSAIRSNSPQQPMSQAQAHAQAQYQQQMRQQMTFQRMNAAGMLPSGGAQNMAAARMGPGAGASQSPTSMPANLASAGLSINGSGIARPVGTPTGAMSSMRPPSRTSLPPGSAGGGMERPGSAQSGHGMPNMVHRASQSPSMRQG
ncbi:hypothetical protein MRB53_037871 [Persea americana]|nr:hypothetical protein MRB53_037871 [Persea americana]